MALFGGAVYVVLRQELYDSFDEQLLNQAALTLAAVSVEDGGPHFASSVATEVADSEFSCACWMRVGDRVRDRGQARGVPLDKGVITAALAGRTAYSAALDEDNETVRLISVPVRPEVGKATSLASSRSGSIGTRSTNRWPGCSRSLAWRVQLCC